MMNFLLVAGLFIAKSWAQNGMTCSNNVGRFSSPGRDGSCQQWKTPNTYYYPQDYNVFPSLQWYKCPSSGYRVLTSNGMGDHQFTQGNPNPPCVNSWFVQVPLDPVYVPTLTEPGDLGPVAMNLNGVPMYGAQDGPGDNAADPPPNGQIQDGQYWWGHAGFDNDWHYHNPWAGSSTQPSPTTLVGYALDGFGIYGPLEDASVLDSCNGLFNNEGRYQYHLRNLDQVDGAGPYCNGTQPAVLWNYIVGCFHGSVEKTVVTSQAKANLPADCVPDADVMLAKQKVDALFAELAREVKKEQLL